MADAAVEFLLRNLHELLLNHADLIKHARGQVDQLENDLRLFKAFLRDSSRKRRRDGSYKLELIHQIRDVVYEAEDIVDAFVTQAAETRSRSYFIRAFTKPVNLHEIATRVESISSQVKQAHDAITRDLAGLDARNGTAAPQEPTEATPIRKDNVVGFDDEALKIIGYLNQPTEQLDVISVVGMPGLGKTTLAGKIFHDDKIQYEFHTRIWVYVSQEFKSRNVYLAILKDFTTITDNVYKLNDQELADKVFKHLEQGKFLIVLDDVWTAEDWDKIQVALPKSNNAGKVLITSRHEEVALRANHQRGPYKLRFLTPDESWLLLQYEVFGRPGYPPELEDVGKIIANECCGLPLAIVVIGGILVKKFVGLDNNTGTMRSAWESVSHKVSTYLNEDPEGRMEKIIALSYDKLPYHLRACFLYLGMFPADFSIPVWKLIRMWIAEGFIQQKENMSLEEIAENHLDELINRNLVRVHTRRSDGKVKTCRIHDMLRDFCKNEGGKEKDNFLEEMKWTPEGFEPPIAEIKEYRRICIHSNVTKFIGEKLFGPHVRSFVCFSNEDTTLPIENSSIIPAAFKLLRVLDVKPIIFRKIPSDMYQLLHLRYIALSFESGVLPVAFSKLWNIETLIVDTSQRTLDIKADIWKLSQLRHLKTNASTSLPKAGKSGNEGKKLQTLGTISPQSCTEEVLSRAHNLKKLGIRGKLASLLDHKTGSFDSLAKLSSLEKLKLLNDVFPMAASEGQLRCLPPSYQFPQKLKSLTLSATYLDWTYMSILGSLEYLEVLKLKDKAFNGTTWKVKDGGFPCLEVLHIDRTDLTLWSASHHHYPRLRCLELHYCEKLLDIPIGLADIRTFQMLHLYHSHEAAATSATKIRDAKQTEHNIGDGEFNLSIFPPRFLP